MKQDSHRSRPCVILAGGQSRRMNGQDKAEAMIGSARLIDHIYQATRPQAERIYLSGRHDYGLGLEVISDHSGGPKGPAAGLYACWKYFSRISQGPCEGFFTVPVDGPNVPNDLMLRLYASNHSAIAADNQRVHPVFGWWRLVDLAAFWRKHSDEDSPSLRFIAKSCRARPVLWAQECPFPNLNTPQDLARYRQER